MTPPISTSRPERAAALAGVLLAAFGAWAALRLATPPAPLAETAPTTEFSAARAMSHVRAIAAEPRPVGSAAHERARAYIEGELQRLGVEPQLQTAWGLRYRRGTLRAASVRNILGRVEGRDGGSPLLLMAHYDSVPTSPGAGDDAAGVATLLETLRAILAGPAPSSDLIFLFTDGEELGLLGARAFVDEHPWAEEVSLVLNFEARGNSGVTTMFETGHGNGRLVREMAAAAAFPFASSLSQEVYRRMPNSTDFTILRDAGINGLNFAFIGNHPAYHSALDTSAALDPGSLQQMGSSAVAMTRRLGEVVDTGSLASSDAVYFNPLAFRLAVYSQSTGRALAILAALALATLLVVGARRGGIVWSGVRRGLLAMLGCLILGPLAALGGWALFVRYFPRALDTPWGEPEATGTVMLAFLLIDIAVAGGLLFLLDGRRPLSLFAGALVPWAATSVALAFLVPGGAYLALWPTLAGIVALGVAIALPETAGVWRLALLSAAALVGAVIFAPVTTIMGEALGVGSAAVVALLMALPVTLLLGHLAAIDRGRHWVVGLAAGGAIALLSWTGIAAGPSPESPRPSSLFYLLDAERGEALWLSADSRVDEWNGQALPAGAEPSAVPDTLPAVLGRELLQGSAPPLAVPAPTAELLTDVREDPKRTVEVRVASPRGAPVIHLSPESDLATVEAVTIDGQRREVPLGDRPVRISLFGVPPEGVTVGLELSAVQPVALGLLDHSYGLPDVPGVEIAPRPPNLIPRLSWLTDTAGVYSVAWF